jgi:hypothetical protein
VISNATIGASRTGESIDEKSRMKEAKEYEIIRPQRPKRQGEAAERP